MDDILIARATVHLGGLAIGIEHPGSDIKYVRGSRQAANVQVVGPAGDPGMVV